MPGNAVINSFTANPSSILKGVSSTLSWNTSFGLFVWLDGVSVGLSGSKIVTPNVTTTYALKCQGELSQVTKTVTITVIQYTPPPPTPPPPAPPPPPPVICTPGALKCIGSDLYVCNPTGNEWLLKQANAPSCKAGGQIPDFWTDPMGWVLAVITRSWEAMLGFVAGQFNLFLANIKNFTDNFMAQLVIFIKDPITALTKWFDEIFPGLRAWIGEAVDGVGKWWDDQVAILQRGWDNTISGVRTWFDDQIGIFQRGWDKVTGDMKIWTNDQLGIMQRGWDNTFAKWIGPVDLRVMSLEQFEDEYPDKVKDDINTGDNIVMTLVKDWVFEQVAGFFNDALKGLNDEFDAMKKK